MLLSCSSDSEVKAEVPANAGKTLVVYYSYTGNCREITNTLTSQIEADVLEIQPAEKGLKYDANGYALGTQLLNAINANPDDANSYPAIDPVTISLDSSSLSTMSWIRRETFQSLLQRLRLAITLELLKA